MNGEQMHQRAERGKPI